MAIHPDTCQCRMNLGEYQLKSVSWAIQSYGHFLHQSANCIGFAQIFRCGIVAGWTGLASDANGRTAQPIVGHRTVDLEAVQLGCGGL